MNPIPHNTATPYICSQVAPPSLDAKPVFTEIQIAPNMPSCLPKKQAKRNAEWKRRKYLFQPDTAKIHTGIGEAEDGK